MQCLAASQGSKWSARWRALILSAPRTSESPSRVVTVTYPARCLAIAVPGPESLAERRCGLMFVLHMHGLLGGVNVLWLRIQDANMQHYGCYGRIRAGDRLPSRFSRSLTIKMEYGHTSRVIGGELNKYTLATMDRSFLGRPALLPARHH